MNVNDFQMIAELLRKRSGLVLSEDKAYLLESRLNPVARRWNLKGFDELAKQVRMGKDEKLLRDVTEAMTTNESFFFRDQRPFEQFSQVVLPALLERRASGRSFRIWSAACSSGQEPYSLAMLLSDAADKLAGWRYEIIATDLSGEVLTKAREGTYSQFEVQRGLPVTFLVKYFKQIGDKWQIDKSIRDKVAFKQFNLLDDLKPLGKFDVIFCRNVLIYFDQPTKSRVLDRLAEVLAPDGYLYLGGAETVLGLSERFQLVPGQRGLYSVADMSQSRIKAAG